MRQLVSSLKDKDPVEGIFLVRTKATPLAKSGKPYLACMLGDKSGQIDSRMWDGVEAVADSFQTDDFVWVRGTVNLYQKRLQLVIGELKKVPKSEVNPADFLPSSETDPEIMFKNLIAIVNGMKNKHLKQLILSTLEDPEIRPKYLRCPAARSIHHAYLGGLLEHTLSICKVMMFIASHYKNVDLDLLLVGAVFHDIGKIWELEFETGVTYTDVGRLVGHLVLGSELIEKKAATIAGFPDHLKTVCKHLVLSHHGKMEFGSPKIPMTLEAYIVAAIDDFDSKVNQIQVFMHNESKKGESWTSTLGPMERPFYLGPTEKA
ncbi:MAG: HD domain-containing protein [Oligoflexia bacterium]|nr:HD domain-containing protein [Oligoflexia bacterium]